MPASVGIDCGFVEIDYRFVKIDYGFVVFVKIYYRLVKAIFTNFASMGLKTYTFDSSANALAQWCTSWYHQFRASVQNPGANPRGIMRLSDDVVLGVQTPRKEPLEEATARSSFSGAGL